MKTGNIIKRIVYCYVAADSCAFNSKSGCWIKFNKKKNVQNITIMMLNKSLKSFNCFATVPELNCVFVLHAKYMFYNNLKQLTSTLHCHRFFLNFFNIVTYYFFLYHLITWKQQQSGCTKLQ